MEYTRPLRRGMAGGDVKSVKDRLVTLGLLYASTHERFGSDTLRAVKAFQARAGLNADGVVGPLTWAALFPAEGTVNEEVPPPPAAFDGDLPANIGETAAQAILPELSGLSDVRRGIVLEALTFAYDPERPAAFPHSLYIRGGNLFNKDLTPNVITLGRIAAGAASQPQYYDGGRREMMEAAVRQNPGITGADCSGGIVGLLRHARACSAGFDANANTLAAKYARTLTRGLLSPGDWLHKNGHIGLYVGGGRGVEWMGGAYGCQLTRVDDRRGHDFVSGKSKRMGAWTGFVRPTYY